MEIAIKLYKREGTYYSAEKKKDVPYTNFYLSLNGQMIAIDIKYFKNPKLDNRDPSYAGKFAQMSMVAELLPPAENKGESSNVPAPSDADAPDAPGADELPS